MIDREFANKVISAFKQLERKSFHNIEFLFYDEDEGDQIYQIKIYHGIKELPDTYSLECKIRKSDINRVGIEKFLEKMYADFLSLNFMKMILD